MNENLGLLIFLLLCCVVPGGMLLLFALLGPRNPNRVKETPFECGLEPLSQPEGLLPVHFYLVGMLFILFDVELVWLFPWARVLREQGTLAFVEMLFFLGFVLAGFGYAWKKGALEWEK